MPLLPHTVTPGDWVTSIDDDYYPSTYTGGGPLFAFNLGIFSHIPTPRNWRASQVVVAGGKLYLSWGSTFDTLTIHEFDTSGVFQRQVCHFPHTGLDWSAARIMTCDQSGRLFAYTGPNNSSLRPPTFHVWRITQQGQLDHDFIFQPIGYVAAGGTQVYSNLYFGSPPSLNQQVDVSADGSRLYFGDGATAFYVDESGAIGIFGETTSQSSNAFSGHLVNATSIAVEWSTGNIFVTYKVEDPFGHSGPPIPGEITNKTSTLRQVYTPGLGQIFQERIQQSHTVSGIAPNQIDDPTTFLFNTRSLLDGEMWLAEKQTFFDSITFLNTVKNTYSRLASTGPKKQIYVETHDPSSNQFTPTFFYVYRPLAPPAARSRGHTQSYYIG